ncbi:MAG: M48 family metalloprotease [Marinilabiliales bacterium]|nr:M48 family metalloprotease [Marinilabiliales bacterium]
MIAPRGGAHRQRRHGDADADPGRGQYLRHLPRARRRLAGRLGAAPRRRRARGAGHRLHGYGRSWPTSCSASWPRIIVMYFSRQREFRADAGAARLLGTPQPMMAALRRLGGMEAGELPQNVATAGINGRPGWMALFSSHPPIEERIAALAAVRPRDDAQRRAPACPGPGDRLLRRRHGRAGDLPVGAGEPGRRPCRNRKPDRHHGVPRLLRRRPLRHEPAAAPSVLKSASCAAAR